MENYRHLNTKNCINHFLNRTNNNIAIKYCVQINMKIFIEQTLTIKRQPDKRQICRFNLRTYNQHTKETKVLRFNRKSHS